MAERVIQCPVCHTENRSGANFCKRCGALLASHCPRCSAALPADSLFCDRCGVRLLQPTPGIWEAQATVPAEPATGDQQLARAPEAPVLDSSPMAPSATQSALQQFVPPELLARLQAAAQRGGMVGERRIVTILFCDTVGSTAAAEKLDPEEWTEIINGAFEHMIRPIYRYEGTVARLMGDGLLAFFGAPIAHEDDPRRAVLAGLQIVEAIAAYGREVQARWDLSLNVRVGINTGKVVVGSVGSDLRMEYTAIGDAINIAARMEQTAEPGSVQVAHDTYRFVERQFEFEPLGPVAVKGKDTPLLAYRVLGPLRGPSHRRAQAGLRAPLLGREDELHRLRQVAGLTTQGVGQIAFVVGEAGLGKSRLLDELRREQTALFWIESAGAAHEAALPFALLRGMLGALVDAWPGAPAAELRDNLLALSAAERREGLAQVLDVLLGLEPAGQTQGAGQNGSNGQSGDGFRRRLTAAIGGLLSDVCAAPTGSAVQPVALALDDVHWADAASVDLLIQLLPLASSLPLFFLFATRPERQAPGWRLRQEAEAVHVHRTTVVNVRPLAPEESGKLIASLLGDNRFPSHVRQLILNKAEGNPFFVEEVVRSLLDRGLVESGEDGLHWLGQDTATEEMAIPDSLQSLLTARIDRLREETRYTLQLAAVIGRSFSYRVLQQVSELGDTLPEQLEDLERRAVIHEAARLPELEYAFHHALMQEAAYRSILLRQRRAFHLRVAEAIEQLFADRLDAFALPLARHFYEAGDPRALRYFRMAGDDAMRVFANVEAAEHYGMAIQCAREMRVGIPTAELVGETDLLYLYRRRGRALELNSRYEEALRHYEELMTQAQARNSRPMELAALIGQARQRVTANPVTDYGKGQKLLERAIPLAQALDDREAEATIMWLNVLLLVFTGQSEQQRAYAERGLALAQELDMKELEAFLLHDMWYVYGAQGQWRKMSEALEQARELWLALDNLPMLAATLVRIQFVQTYRGLYEQALQTAEEAYELGVESRDPESQVLSRALLGAVHLERGRIDLALAISEETVAQAQAIDNVTVLTIGPAYMGWIYAICGNFERALELARGAVNYATQHFPLISGFAKSILVRVLLLCGDVGEASRVLQESEDYDELRRQMGFFAPGWLTTMIASGEVALAEGRLQEALEISSEFVRLARVDGIHNLLPDAFLLQGRAHLALQRQDEAREVLQEGLAEAEWQGSQRMLWPILTVLGQLATEAGDVEQAQALRHRAAAIIDYMASHSGSEELRESFLAQEAVRAAR